MKIFFQILKQFAETVDLSDLTNLKKLGGALLCTLGEWLKQQADQPTPMGASEVDEDELDSAIEHCQTAIVKLGGAVPMMASASGDRRAKLLELIKVLLPLLLAL